MNLTIGFSPCPNDTFIFDAMVNGKINTGNLIFETVLEDVETLNKGARDYKLDVSKLSYGVLPLVLEKYVLLNSGSALGSGVGPLLISKAFKDLNDPEIQVAIPGEFTTAHLLFTLAYPQVKNKIFMRYDEIENFVQQQAEKVAGVIIHENRFTYQDRGLISIRDLGDYWQSVTNSAIPLGGIVAKRSLPLTIRNQVQELIRSSLNYSLERYPELSTYVKQHAQEMEESVVRKHIDLYVNTFTMDLGDEGKHAIDTLLQVYNNLHGSNISSASIYN